MKRLFFVLLLIINVLYAYGQKNIPAYDFYHLKMPGGLELNSITCFAQDSTGLMWIGTKDGLIRYDTQNFKIFKHHTDTGNSLIENFVTDIYVENNGNLLIATIHGLQEYDKERGFTEILPGLLHNSKVIRLIKQSGNEIWILPFDKKQIIKYNIKPRKHIAYEFDEIIDNLHFIDIIKYDDRTLFITTNKAFMLKFDIATNKFEKIYFYTQAQIKSFPLLKSYLSKLLVDKKQLWITTHFGYAFIYNPQNNGQEKFYYRKKFPPNRRHYYAMDIMKDRDGNIWIGTWFDGVYQILPDRKNFVHLLPDRENPHSLSNNIITKFYQDKAGNLWLASEFAGINILNKDKKFNVISYDKHDKNSLPPFPVLSICGDTLNRIFVGTDSGRMVYFDREHPEIKRVNPSVFNNAVRFFYIYKDTVTHRFWVGTEKGLFDFNPYRFTAKNYTYQRDDYNSLSSWNIFAIARNGDNLWVGTFSRGLNKWNLSKRKNIRFLHDDENPNSLSANYISDIACNTYGDVWIGTNNGLNKFDKKTGNFKIYKTNASPRSISYDKISCLYSDDDKLWIGTNGGDLSAYTYKTGQFERYDISDKIAAINKDNKGDLWIASGDHLIKFNPETHLKIVYDATDGIENSLYIRDYGQQRFEFLDHSDYKDKDGYLYFGGTTGMLLFHPDSLPHNNYKPPVIIDQFFVNGKRKTLKTNTINLKPDENTIAIDLLSLNYIQPEKNQYAYKLEPCDSLWHYGSRKAEYFNLPYGDYIFHYKASNNDNVWNTRTKPLYIHLAPYFYQTRIFQIILVALLLLIALAFVLYKKYLKMQMEKKRKLLRYHQSNLTNEEIESINAKLLEILPSKIYLQADLSLHKLAKEIGVIPNYLSQVINEKYDKNFREFINMYRVQEAKRLLMETSLKIEAIAFDCGFNTLSTFYQAFKKETGMTPSVYRKKYWENTEN